MMNKEFERMQRLNMLKSMCFQDSALYGWTFENDNGKNLLINKAKTYADKWSDMLSKNIGLLLWGEVGTGKTYFAACIANALVENCVSVKMTNFSTILNDLFYENDKNRYINRLNNHDLLIIDDLGAEAANKFNDSILFDVFDERISRGKKFIISTNLDIKELGKTYSMRFVSRIMENFIVCRFYGDDIRYKTIQ